MAKFRMLLGAAKMPEDGYALGKELAEASKGDAAALNEIAWFVLDDKSVEVRDIPFALETAKAAVAATDSPDPAIMDTLARAYWESGDKPKAVEWQGKAVKAAGDEREMAEELGATLKKYQSGDAPSPAKKMPPSPRAHPRAMHRPRSPVTRRFPAPAALPPRGRAPRACRPSSRRRPRRSSPSRPPRASTRPRRS
jgi:hypothetical protein